jgi:hypothetical protein
MAKAPAMSQQQQLQNINAFARAAIVGNSVKMEQQIFSRQFSPADEPVINVQPRYAGLILGFIVEVSGTIRNTGTAVANRTQFGMSNAVSQFRFDDLSNYTRIQVPGWYMSLLNTIRQGFAFGGTYANNLPINLGTTFNVFNGPATIAAAGNAPVRQVYYVPISYSNTDLRGAIWASVVNATMNLQIAINNSIGFTTGSQVNAIYGGANTIVSWLGNVRVDVYQVYLDQLPRDNQGQVLLPPLDLNMVYDLKQTTFSGITQGQDFPMAYSNFRQFLSTVAVFDNGTQLNAGTDVSYWALQAANFANIWKFGPEYASLKARGMIMSDMPAGCYLFSSRDIPINTINFGNMELVLNASLVNANARVLVGYESFGLVNQLAGATSLAAN